MDASNSSHSYFPLTHTPQGVGVMPEVAGLGREELEDLLGCEDKMAEFVEALPQLASLRATCDQLASQNQALAQSNLERSSDYEKVRGATILKVEELEALRGSFQDMTVVHQKESEKLAPSNLQESLLIFAAQSEEESEKIAESFLNSHVDVDGFLEQYLEKRIEAHLRKFKGERLGAQLHELHKAGF